jgi:hypothetical protein
MRQFQIANVMLLLTVAVTGPVGVAPMSLGILGLYALIRDVAQRDKLLKGKERAAMRAVGVYAVAMLACFVWLWSVRLDYSFYVGGAIWLGTIATLEHGLQIATRWNARQKAGAILAPLVDDRKAA